MTKNDGRKLDHQTNEHLRRLSVRRVVEGGERPSEVMRSLGLCRTTIYRWLRAFAKKGDAALAARKMPGRKPALTGKQCQRVKRWIVGKDPRQYGFEFGLWTRRIVSELIADKFGVTLKLTAVGRLLARLEITPQKPLRRAYERDPKAVEQWLARDYPRLKRRARKHGAAIFFLDEAGFTSEPGLGRTYGLKGQTPVVRTTGQRQKVNAISALNARGAFWSAVHAGSFNATRFVGFLKDFRRGRKAKVYLVVDGHPSHRAKLVRKYVQGTRGRLELHFLPPYAPDLNPDEFVWQHTKTNGVAKKPLRKGESLKQRVTQDLEKVKANRNLVRSLFGAATVAYATD